MSTIAEPFKIDIPVALIFFDRPDHLVETFAKISELKPSILFLIQDGESGNNQDRIKRINESRKIVEKINWQCEVHRNYSEINLGCGKRVHSGITWAFTYVDKLVIIEDDCVPGDSFLIFSKYMLEKYENDDRVAMISGMNHFGKYDHHNYDYFFSEGGTIWGWATWKRVWDKIDYEMKWMEEEYITELVERNHGKYYINQGLIKREQLARGEKLRAWSYQHGINMFLNNQLILIPRVNLVTNIGNTRPLNHLPGSLRSLYFKETYKLDPPYKGPDFIMNDLMYSDAVEKILAQKNKFKKFVRAVRNFIIYRFKL